MNLQELRHQAIMYRGGYKYAICDYCGINRATDLHHIISKGRTHNIMAREASECLELTSMVCADCHIGTYNVHNPKATEALLATNVTLFGYEAVDYALANVNQYLTIPIIIPLLGGDFNG